MTEQQPILLDVECQAGKECVGYDAETDQAWWDHIDDSVGGDWTIEIAIVHHLTHCKGPMQVSLVDLDITLCPKCREAFNTPELMRAHECQEVDLEDARNMVIAMGEESMKVHHPEMYQELKDAGMI